MKLLKQLSFIILALALVLSPFSLSVHKVHAADTGITLKVKDDKGQNLLNEQGLTNPSDNKSALEILQAEGQKEGLTIDVKDSDYGPYINSINNLSQEDKVHYWAFYLNGVQSFNYPNYKPTNGDELLYQFIPSASLLNDEVSIAVNSDLGTRVKISNQDTVLSALQKLKGIDQVTIKDNQLEAIGDQKADATHNWSVTLTRSGKDQSVSDLSTPIQGKDKLSFTLDETKSKAAAPSPSEVNTVSKDQISIAINQATSYVNKNGVADWDAISLAQAGKFIPKTYLSNTKKAIQDAKGEFHAITDYSRYTLGILAAGSDPTDFSGYNLVKPLYSSDITKQGLNGVIYSLIALESAEFKVPENAKWTTTKMKNELLSHQNKDGGWAWDASKTSDPDTTAMVITALAKQQDDSKVLAALKKADVYLSDQFKQGKIDNSSTAAQVIIALTTSKIDPQSTDFTKADGTTLVAFLLTFQNKDGGFDWKGGNKSDSFSTQQGFQALVAEQLFLNGKGSLYSFTLQKKEKADTTAVSKTTSDKQTTTSKETQGEALPDTATNAFNYLIVGILFIFIGAAYTLFLRNRA